MCPAPLQVWEHIHPLEDDFGWSEDDFCWSEDGWSEDLWSEDDFCWSEDLWSEDLWSEDEPVLIIIYFSGKMPTSEVQ